MRSAVRPIRYVAAALLAASGACLVQLWPSPAAAQYFWWDGPQPGYAKPKRKRIASTSSQLRLTAERSRKSRPVEVAKADTDGKDAREKGKPKAVAAPAIATPLLTVVSISDQKVHVYDSTGVIDRGSVSTGQSGHRTPTGVFSIIQKNRWHHSNIYSGAPMPYMQRITWSGIAMHQGVLPGYPASHGCIRLSQSFASEHFGRTKLGMRVVVSPEPTSAVSITHAKLPVPAFTPAPGAPAVATSGGEGNAAGLVQVASAEDGPVPAQAPVKLLSPIDRAVAAKAQAAANVGLFANNARLALEAAGEKSAAAQAALAALRSAEATLVDAKAALEGAARQIERAQTPEETEAGKTAKSAAEARLAAAEKAHAEARTAEDARRDEAFAAARAARDAESAAELAVQTAKASSRWTETVSVFVSKKEGRVYVRQGFAPIFDAPVTISEPETPIGTHLYVAMDAGEDGRALKWSAVTVPNSGVAPAQSGRKKGEKEPSADVRPRETAAGALERVSLPEEVRKLIADKLWPGASIIISDYGISNEQGEGASTDFIVLTR